MPHSQITTIPTGFLTNKPLAGDQHIQELPGVPLPLKRGGKSPEYHLQEDLSEEGLRSQGQRRGSAKQQGFPHTTPEGPPRQGPCGFREGGQDFRFSRVGVVLGGGLGDLEDGGF